MSHWKSCPGTWSVIMKLESPRTCAWCDALLHSLKAFSFSLNQSKPVGTMLSLTSISPHKLEKTTAALFYHFQFDVRLTQNTCSHTSIWNFKQRCAQPTCQSMCEHTELVIELVSVCQDWYMISIQRTRWEQSTLIIYIYILMHAKRQLHTSFIPLLQCMPTITLVSVHTVQHGRLSCNLLSDIITVSMIRCLKDNMYHVQARWNSIP